MILQRHRNYFEIRAPTFTGWPRQPTTRGLRFRRGLGLKSCAIDCTAFVPMTRVGRIIQPSHSHQHVAPKSAFATKPAFPRAEGMSAFGGKADATVSGRHFGS
jgi:hypothetical protein